MTAAASSSTEATTQLGDGAGSRLPSLTGMRVLAGLAVFTTHGLALGLFSDFNAFLTYVRYGANAGVFGIGFFFVLTGFVVTWTASSTDTARQFWRRRFFKIMPNHVVFYAIILALWIPTGYPLKLVEGLFGLFLISAWVPNESFFYFNLNGPMWSAGIDVLAYALFPLLYFLVKKIRPSRLWGWAIATMALSVVMAVVAENLMPDTPPSSVLPMLAWPKQWLGFYFPLTRLPEFVVGILMARIVQTGRWIGLGVLPATVILIGVYLSSVDFILVRGLVFVPLIPIALLIPAIAVCDIKGKRSFLNSRPMVWLGDRMYAFFVVHITVMFMIDGLFSGENGVTGAYERKSFGTGVAILILIGLYFACLLVSMLLFALVEDPVMRRWSRPRRRTADASRVGNGGDGGGDVGPPAGPGRTHAT